jgi:hypothetical protein
MNPVAQVRTHLLALHAVVAFAAAWHSAPHAPQFCESCRGSMQLDSHSTRLAEHEAPPAEPSFGGGGGGSSGGGAVGAGGTSVEAGGTVEVGGTSVEAGGTSVESGGLDVSPGSGVLSPGGGSVEPASGVLVVSCDDFPRRSQMLVFRLQT